MESSFAASTKTLNQYRILRTLGSGASCKVKLAQDPHTSQLVAIKLMDPAMDEEARELLDTEVQAMQQLQHENILRQIECGYGTYSKPSGSSKRQFIALELAEVGELFDILAMTGPFKENIARFYFHQFMSGLQYCHNKGIIHRDLKTENLLLNKDYTLKIADFGYATAVIGRKGDGQLHTYLGTPNFMSPQIHENLPYDGRASDLFAAGVILFLMIAGHPPFGTAQQSDSYYKCIKRNMTASFWEHHSKGKEPISEELKDLISSMLQFEEAHRPSMLEVFSHPWMQGAMPSIGEVKQDITKRVAEVFASKEDERTKKRGEREESLAALVGVDLSVVNRNLDIKEAIEIQQSLFEADTVSKKLSQFIPTTNPHFFSCYKPEIIENVFTEFLDKEKVGYDKNDNKFKLKFMHTGKNKEGDEFAIQTQMRIYKYNDKQVAVEFQHCNGDKYQAQQLQKTYMLMLQQFDDSSIQTFKQD